MVKIKEMNETYFRDGILDDLSQQSVLISGHDGENIVPEVDVLVNRRRIGKVDKDWCVVVDIRE